MIVRILASGCFFYLAFPNIFSLQGFSVLSWIFAIPLFSALNGRPLIARLFIGFLFGVFANLATLNWMMPYSFPGYLLLGLTLSTQPVIFACLYRYLNHPAVGSIYAAGAWVVSEYLRKFIMQGESWNLAHTQTFDIALMQMASVLGSSSLSFLLIAVNDLLYRSLRRSENIKVRIQAIVIALILVAAGYGYGFLILTKIPAPLGEAVRVRIVQTDHDYRGEIPGEKVHAIVDQNIALTLRSFEKTDLVIWPETAIPLDFRKDSILKSKISSFAQQVQAYVLIGAVMEDDRGKHNSAVLIGKDGEIRQVYHKRHLIPLTEFIPPPLGWQVFAKIFRVETPDLIAGQGEDKLMEIPLQGRQGTVRFGVAICSEDNIDHVFKDIARQGAAFAVVILNNGWFIQKPGAVMHGQHSVVRAVENHILIARCANRGLSGLIDEFGGVSQNDLDSLSGERVIDVRIPFFHVKMLSNNLHDIFCLMCVGFVILMPILAGKWKNS